MSGRREPAYLSVNKRRIDRYIPHADGWGAYQLRENWSCRDCSRLLGRDQLAWYLRDFGPFCTRCRNKAVSLEGGQDGS